MSDDEIGFTQGELKETPEIEEVDELKEKAVKKLEQLQVDKQVRAEAGITEIPKEPEAVPKELPKICFKIGSKIFSCEKFQLDDDEAKVFAKHLSILIGAQNSKVYSILIIITITISKVWGCWDAVMNKIKRKKLDNTGTDKIPETKSKIPVTETLG